jgi:hypothetical protein
MWPLVFAILISVPKKLTGLNYITGFSCPVSEEPWQKIRVREKVTVEVYTFS